MDLTDYWRLQHCLAIFLVIKLSTSMNLLRCDVFPRRRLDGGVRFWGMAELHYDVRLAELFVLSDSDSLGLI